MGVGRNQLVGIHFERGIEHIISVLATLKAGAAYLPLDTGYSKERMQFVLADSAAKIVLADIEHVSCGAQGIVSPLMLSIL